MLHHFARPASLVALLSLLACSAQADNTLTFDNLSNGNLAGQDGWINSHLAPQIADGTGVDTSKVVIGGSGADVAIRPRGVVPTAQNSSILQFDANLNGNPFGTSLFGLADAGGNQSLVFGLNVPGSGPQTGTSSFYLSDRSSQFNSNGYLATAIPAGTSSDWYRLRMSIDFTANGGDGAAGISEEDLTLGDTSFTPITGLQDINLGLNAGNAATLQPTTWTNDWLYVTSNGALDNLSVGSVPAADTPEPNAYTLLLAASLFGTVALSRCKAGNRRILWERTSTLATTFVRFAALSLGGTLCLSVAAQTAQAQDLFVVDSRPGTILRFSPSGTVSTFFSGLSSPQGLAITSAGDLYVSVRGDNSIVKITAGGVESTFATGLNSPSDLAFDRAGNLYAANSGTGSILKFTPGGVQSTFATGVGSADGLAFDRAGNLFVSDYGEGTPGTGNLYKVTPGGSVSTFATGLGGPTGLAFDSDGTLFASAASDHEVWEYTPDGTKSAFASSSTPVGLAFDSQGDLYQADYFSIIRKYTPDGSASVFTGEVDRPLFIDFVPAADTPEPGAVALLICGSIAGTGLLRRRSRKR